MDFSASFFYTLTLCIYIWSHIFWQKINKKWHCSLQSLLGIFISVIWSITLGNFKKKNVFSPLFSLLNAFNIWSANLTPWLLQLRQTLMTPYVRLDGSIRRSMEMKYTDVLEYGKYLWSSINAIEFTYWQFWQSNRTTVELDHLYFEKCWKASTKRAYRRCKSI